MLTIYLQSWVVIQLYWKIILVLLLSMTLIRAQTGNDVVYLLQGGKLEGEIIENVAGSFIVIRTEKQTKKINYNKIDFVLSQNDVTKISHTGIKSGTKGLVGTFEKEEIDRLISELIVDNKTSISIDFERILGILLYGLSLAMMGVSAWIL